MNTFQREAIDAAFDAKLHFKCDTSPNDDALLRLYAVERIAGALDRHTAALWALRTAWLTRIESGHDPERTPGG